MLTDNTTNLETVKFYTQHKQCQNENDGYNSTSNVLCI